MKTKLLLLMLLAGLSFLNAQTTETISIDWGFNSTPSASGAANTDRTIEIGDTVEWKWFDGGFHNVVSNGGTESFNSGATTNTPGVNFSYTFNQIGSTSFICQPHAGIMFGTITVVAEGTLSIDEFRSKGFSIYPNPTNKLINIDKSLSSQIDKIKIFDLLGKEMYSNNGFQKQIDISYFPKGLYFLKISSEGISKTKKIIKN